MYCQWILIFFYSFDNAEEEKCRRENKHGLKHRRATLALIWIIFITFSKKRECEIASMLLLFTIVLTLFWKFLKKRNEEVQSYR